MPPGQWLESLPRTASLAAKRVWRSITATALHIATLPYYRLFEFNTLGPIKRIAAYNKDPDKAGKVVIVLSKWRERKMSELHFISIACTVLAGAVIGSFSWNNITNAYWLASACWYCSLVFSILGILLAAQQIAVLNLLGPFHRDQNSDEAMDIADRYLPLLLSGPRRMGNAAEGQKQIANAGPCRPRWQMVFTWQCPIMFMSYSVCTFLLGVTLVVITPLIRLRESGWTGDATVSIIYLVVAAIATVMFMFCSFWVYHYVQLDSDTLLDTDEDVGQQQRGNATGQLNENVMRG